MPPGRSRWTAFGRSTVPVAVALLALVALLAVGAVAGVAGRLGSGDGSSSGSSGPAGGAPARTFGAASASRAHAGQGHGKRAGDRAHGRATAAGRSAAATPLSSLRGAPATVAISTASPRPPVPPNFLGLSFEVRELPLIGRLSDQGDLVNLLKSLRGSVMRFGGLSVDQQTAWIDAGARRPSWAVSTFAAVDLRGIARLADAAGWSVLMSVGLGHPDAADATAEAAAAHQLLGSHLAGIAIGNEPDRYVHDGLRPAGWGFSNYLQEIGGLLPALHAAAPGVPIIGPDAATGVTELPWLSDYAAAEHPTLLTDHYYPTSRCGTPPTIDYLLGPVIRSQMQTALGDLTAISQQTHTPVRIDEANNVSCSGQPGVSNSFGSALWALEFITQAMQAGMAGLNFHDILSEPQSYGPLAAFDIPELERGDLHAQPEWYALLLADRLVGNRPVQAVAGGSAAQDLSTYALLDGHGDLQVVLVDTGGHGAPDLVVHLAAPALYDRGAILRLTAPGLAATGGVTLGGQAVADDGTWRPDGPLPAVSGGSGTLAVALPAGSAALVTLYPKADGSAHG